MKKSKRIKSTFKGVKSVFRATAEYSSGGFKTRYTDSPVEAYEYASRGKTGTISRLNKKTNRFKKETKFGW